MGRLDDKVCVITGTASGIGAEMARVFKGEGATVVGVDLNESETVDINIRADVTDEQQVAGMYGRTKQEFGRVDVLVNNAGINPPEDESVLDTPVETWQWVQDVNVRSVFLCCKHGIPHLLEAGGGSVINTASFVAVMGAAVVADLLHGVQGRGAVDVARDGRGVRPPRRARERALPGPGGHAAAAGAVRQFARQGVRVNALCPGPVDTPLLQELFAPTRPRRRGGWCTCRRAASARRADRRRRAVPGQRRVAAT